MQTSDANAAAARVRIEAAQAGALATDGAAVHLGDPQLPGPTVLVHREWRAFFSMARGQFWFLPAMVVLALLTSLFEGVGLTLVIPLVQSLGQEGEAPTSRGYLGFVQDFIGSIPSADRTGAVLGLMFAAILAKSVFSYANMTLLGLVYGRISHRLRTAIFNRIVSIPLVTLERQQSGTLLNTLSNETWRVTDAVNHIFVIITSVSTAVVFIALLVVLDWKMALLAIGCLSLIPPVVHLVSRKAKTLSKVALETNEALAQQTWSTINGLRTIHTFGREAYEQERFNRISDRVRHLFLKMVLVSMSSGPITEIMATGIIALLVLFVSAHAGGVATLVAFVAILYRLQPRLMTLVSAQTQLASLDASIAAVGALLQGERESHVSNEMRPVIDGPISFHNVTFRYEDASAPAIQDFSFQFPSIGIVAIVGASGPGNSTLLDLILGFQVPESGEIRVGGLGLTDAIAPAWRQRTGVVSQDPYVFDDTVRANILYGRPDASDAEVVRVAQAVAADEFIRVLPQGYDTRIGERAANLSGGQRQRIALARALLRNPDLLLLDEATNALDANTEAELQATLKKFASNRAVVVVAHRFSTVEIADHVIVLANGRIAEQGRPAVLASAGGLFADMFSAAPSQQLERSLAAGAGAT
jgi:ATP-binding cassette, subfamily B, bacterial MsbA